MIFKKPIVIFVCVLLCVNVLNAKTKLWGTNAERYNMALAELIFFQSIDDSTFNLMYKANGAKMKHRFQPSIAFHLTPHGISKIRISSVHGFELPLRVFTDISKELINNNTDYPWITGNVSVLRWQGSCIVTTEEDKKSHLPAKYDTLERKARFMEMVKDHYLTVTIGSRNEMVSDYSQLYSMRPFYSLPSHVYGDRPIGDITRTEVIRNRQAYLDNWLITNKEDLEKYAIDESEYKEVFGKDFFSKEYKECQKPIIEIAY